MDIREALTSVGSAGYDPHGNRDQAVFGRLDDLADALRAAAPAHYIQRCSHGVGNLPRALWVASLDPDVTDSPTRGLYLVWLFDEALSNVTLSLNQGVTAARERASQIPDITPRALLLNEASDLRSSMGIAPTDPLAQPISLGDSALPRLYEAGHIAGQSWSLNALPSDAELAKIYLSCLELYARAVEVREESLASGAGGLHALPPRSTPATPSASRASRREFKPKDSSEYTAHIGESEQRRSRSHEEVVRRFGPHAERRGFEPNTNTHPVDLRLHRGDLEVIAEVKVVKPGSPQDAVRQAIGQLMEYRHFLGPADAPLLAVFSEDPGGAYVELLIQLGIAAVWKSGNDWAGSGLAEELGIA